MGNKSSLAASGGTASTIVADAVTDSHVLRIDGYSTTKGRGVGKGIDSQIFYVGGFAWSVRYYPDGRSDTCADWISSAAISTAATWLTHWCWPSNMGAVDSRRLALHFSGVPAISGLRCQPKVMNI